MLAVSDVVKLEHLGAAAWRGIIAALAGFCSLALFVFVAADMHFTARYGILQ